MNCKDYRKDMQEKDGGQGSENKVKATSNFSVALSAVMSGKDFKVIEKQF